MYRSGFLTNRRGQRLFLAEDRPADASATTPVWMICSPILEEKNVSHGAMVTLARALAASGRRAIRIDYEGHGDSAGTVAPLGLDDWVEDVVDAAIEAGRDGAGPVTFIGCRAGAIVAARAAALYGADRVVTWCPVVTGADYVHELLRTNLGMQLASRGQIVRTREAMIAALDTGDTVNVLGWDIGAPLVRSLEASTLTSAFGALSCPIDVLDLSRRTPAAVAPAVTALAARPGIEVRAVPGVQFWIDGNFLDTHQAGLVSATLAIGAETVRS